MAGEWEREGLSAGLGRAGGWVAFSVLCGECFLNFTIFHMDSNMKNAFSE